MSRKKREEIFTIEEEESGEEEEEKYKIYRKNKEISLGENIGNLLIHETKYVVLNKRGFFFIPLSKGSGFYRFTLDKIGSAVSLLRLKKNDNIIPFRCSIPKDRFTKKKKKKDQKVSTLSELFEKIKPKNIEVDSTIYGFDASPCGKKFAFSFYDPIHPEISSSIVLYEEMNNQKIFQNEEKSSHVMSPVNLLSILNTKLLISCHINGYIIVWNQEKGGRDGLWGYYVGEGSFNDICRLGAFNTSSFFAATKTNRIFVFGTQNRMEKSGDANTEYTNIKCKSNVLVLKGDEHEESRFYSIHADGSFTIWNWKNERYGESTGKNCSVATERIQSIIVIKNNGCLVMSSKSISHFRNGLYVGKVISFEGGVENDEDNVPCSLFWLGEEGKKNGAYGYIRNEKIKIDQKKEYESGSDTYEIFRTTPIVRSIEVEVYGSTKGFTLFKGISLGRFPYHPWVVVRMYDCEKETRSELKMERVYELDTIPHVDDKFELGFTLVISNGNYDTLIDGDEQMCTQYAKSGRIKLSQVKSEEIKFGDALVYLDKIGEEVIARMKNSCGRYDLRNWNCRTFVNLYLSVLFKIKCAYVTKLLHGWEKINWGSVWKKKKKRRRRRRYQYSNNKGL